MVVHGLDAVVLLRNADERSERGVLDEVRGTASVEPGFQALLELLEEVLAHLGLALGLGHAHELRCRAEAFADPVRAAPHLAEQLG